MKAKEFWYLVLLVAKPSRALALSCNKGRTVIPTNRIALLFKWTLWFGSSWCIEAIGAMFFFFVSAFLVQEYKNMGWEEEEEEEEERKRDWQRGECKKQELPTKKPIAWERKRERERGCDTVNVKRRLFFLSFFLSFSTGLCYYHQSLMNFKNLPSFLCNYQQDQFIIWSILSSILTYIVLILKVQGWNWHEWPWFWKLKWHNWHK